MRVFEVDEVIDNEINIALSKHLHTEDEPMHSHKFLEISYVYSGSGYQNINGSQCYVRHGDLMLFLSKDKHSFSPEGSLGIYNCLVSPKYFGERFTDPLSAADILTLTSFTSLKPSDLKPLIPLNNKYFEIENIFEAMELEFERKEPGYVNVLHNYLEILLTKIFRRQQASSNINLSREIIKIAPEILNYIEEHYNQKITLNYLAQRSFYTPSYFSRIFKECFNKTLTDFIAELRIKKAMQLLQEGKMSVETIAMHVGYSDKKTFYKVFKKITGTTPKKYVGK